MILYDRQNFEINLVLGAPQLLVAYSISNHSIRQHRVFQLIFRLANASAASRVFLSNLIKKKPMILVSAAKGSVFRECSACARDNPQTSWKSNHLVIGHTELEIRMRPWRKKVELKSLKLS